MGKFKKARAKSSKVVSKIEENKDNLMEIPKDNDMSFAKYKRNLSEIDTRSVRSFKSIKSEVSGEKQMRKKDKLKLRHDILLHRIDTTIKSQNETKKRKRKLKKAISGNMVPLYDALPNLQSLLKPKDAPVTKHVNEPKPKAVYKTSTRRKQMKNQKDLFSKLMNHPTFKANPQEVISSHIEATISENIN